MLTLVKRSTWISIVLFIFTACQPKNPVPSKNKVIETINHQNQVFMESYRNNNLDAFADVYSRDGKMMPPNMEEINGREAIKQHMQDMYSSGVSAIELSTQELYVTENNAIEIGHYKVKIDGGQVVDNGKSMVFWKKEDGENWRIFRDIWNSSLSNDSEENASTKP